MGRRDTSLGALLRQFGFGSIVLATRLNSVVKQNTENGETECGRVDIYKVVGTPRADLCQRR